LSCLSYRQATPNAIGSDELVKLLMDVLRKQEERGGDEDGSAPRGNTVRQSHLKMGRGGLRELVRRALGPENAAKAQPGALDLAMRALVLDVLCEQAYNQGRPPAVFLPAPPPPPPHRSTRARTH
jgi:hypothetical protein